MCMTSTLIMKMENNVNIWATINNGQRHVIQTSLNYHYYMSPWHTHWCVNPIDPLQHVVYHVAKHGNICRSHLKRTLGFYSNMGFGTLFTPKRSPNFTVNSSNIVTRVLASPWLHMFQNNWKPNAINGYYKEVASIQMTSPMVLIYRMFFCYWFIRMSPLAIVICTHALVFPRKRVKPPMLLFQ